MRAINIVTAQENDWLTSLNIASHDAPLNVCIATDMLVFGQDSFVC